MGSNSIGEILKISSYGESHGTSVGVIIDGFPAGIKIDLEQIQYELNRRKPGQSKISTSRPEDDLFEITSGIFEGTSTGHPIHISIPNKAYNKADYKAIESNYRPSHADFTYDKKYGIRDPFGGGRSSARITAGWVAAGALAKQLLNQISNLKIHSFVKQIYNIALVDDAAIDLANIESNIVRCPDAETAKEMIAEIEKAKQEGDSLGGIIHTVVLDCPIGLGDPVFDKLHANLGKAVLSINACKGFQFGSGFNSVFYKGSEYNDHWEHDQGLTKTTSNNSGGIQGGISNGEVIYFDAVFRPTSSISKEQKTINKDNQNVSIKTEGRHDPCVVPRAVPIVEAMTAIVLADHLLRQKTTTLNNIK